MISAFKVRDVVLACFDKPVPPSRRAYITEKKKFALCEDIVGSLSLSDYISINPTESGSQIVNSNAVGKVQGNAFLQKAVRSIIQRHEHEAGLRLYLTLYEYELLCNRIAQALTAARHEIVSPRVVPIGDRVVQ